MTPSRARARLSVSPSLNRTVLDGFPALPDGMAGVRANGWLSAWGVPRRMAVRPEIRRALAGLDPRPDLPDAGAQGGGSTTVKRALVAAGGGGDEGHRMLERPPVSTPQGPGDEVVAALADAAAGPVSELPDPGGGLDLSVALATYVDETGQPYAGQLGPYATLGDVDLVGDLAARLGAVLDRAVAVRVTHDGASALLGALTTDPAVDAAIVLGTSIGSGLR